MLPPQNLGSAGGFAWCKMGDTEKLKIIYHIDYLFGEPGRYTI